MKHLRKVSVLVVLAGMLALATSAGAATIIINNTDGAGEGFNDTTPWAPTGGNPATTLGQARLNAFQYAADLAGACLVSNVTIIVNASMDPLTCNATSAVLGSAGAVSVLRDFGGPLAGTWYGMALANALTGVDNDPGFPDIQAQFNSSINGSAGCLSGYSWYYGYNAVLPPGNWIDFITVVEHEICHGLGFQSFINVSTGAEFNNFDDVYEANTESHNATPSTLTTMTNAQRLAAMKTVTNLHWVGANVQAASGVLTAGKTGTHVQLYAPTTVAPGSTYSHFSTACTPDEMMEPNYTVPNHNRSLAAEAFKDEGWTLQCPVAVAISSFNVRATDRGAQLSARFESTFPNVLVNVYRGEGSMGGLNAMGTIAMNGKSTFSYNDDTAVPGKSYRYMLGVVDGDGEFVSQIQLVTMPGATTRLEQNSPNPFNPQTAIRFTLAARQNVTLSVYDVSGRLVRTLVSGAQEMGTHSVTWDGRDSAGSTVSSGVYFYRLDAGKFSDTRKMVMLK
ncbi:MAG TPA: FlgD immunoglobulin-like domain containing protein [Candidatus Krumholzibacteria bacterium]|nr:FlgD immunoglobulin-like domain containing protein [Candidatus Krumholzibacteria bacterium]